MYACYLLFSSTKRKIPLCLYRSIVRKAADIPCSRCASSAKIYFTVTSKGKGHPVTFHAGTSGEYKCSSILSLASALDGGGLSAPRRGRFTPRQYPITHSTGGVTCCRTGLDGKEQRKISFFPPYWDSNLESCSSQRVAFPAPTITGPCYQLPYKLEYKASSNFPLEY